MFLAAPLIGDSSNAAFSEYIMSEIGILLVALLVLCGPRYVLESVGFYRMAQLRKMPRPWLAWIPYGRTWLLGNISDHYQKNAKGKRTNRRKWLLGLEIASAVLWIAIVAFFIVILRAIANEPTEENGYVVLVSMVMRTSLLIFAATVVACVSGVAHYISLFDVFRSCDPSRAVLFLILTIVISIVSNWFSWIGFVPGIFVFVNRFYTYGIPSSPPSDGGFCAQSEMPDPQKVDWQHNRPDDPWKL